MPTDRASILLCLYLISSEDSAAELANMLSCTPHDRFTFDVLDARAQKFKSICESWNVDNV
jgi:hypothetical protein